LVASMPVLCHAATDEGFFVDGALGRGSRGIYGSDSTAAALDVGYRWSWFGVDVGYIDLSKEHAPIFGTSNVPESSQQLYRYGSAEHGFTLDASGRWNIGDHFYYSARAGLYAWHNTFYQDYYEPLPIHTKSSQDAVSWNAGLGIGYDFSKNFSLGLRYDWYHGDHETTHPLSLNAEVRF
jgi:OOP family OmpA-OmpF porin